MARTVGFGAEIAPRPPVTGNKAPKPEDILELRDSIGKLVTRCKGGPLRAHEPEDLVQEVMLKALITLGRFDGRAGLKTWVLTVAKNHLVSMARASASRPAKTGQDVFDYTPGPTPATNIPEIRSETARLLEWLRGPEGREEIPDGYEVMNLMLWNHAKIGQVSFALQIKTARPWTEEGVRNVVRKIRSTPYGQALCTVVGIKT